ncbi:MAG: amidohydrolase [Acidobacteria bacterium]|nr:amidohydrolase [Acidobacteriota bacterium]
MKSLITLLLFPGLVAAGVSTSKADLVLQHGKIYTMDAARSWADSIAITDGQIVYVGDDSGVRSWIADGTRTIDLAGRFVMPSFIDAHVHPLSAGVELGQCALTDASTLEGILATVKQYAAEHPALAWVLGSNWQLPTFRDANPRKEWLDAIVPDRPVLLTSADGHSAWANSKALEIAGVTRSTTDPEDGRIERSAGGEPTGTLRESAIDLVYKMAPASTLEERVVGLRRAVRIMNGFGITGFHDASVTEDELKAYAEVERTGGLTVRAITALYADPMQPVEQIERLKRLRRQYHGKYFQATAVKIFEDGVIEPATAALLKPYLGRDGDAGSLNWEPEKLNPLVAWLDREQFQVHFHAIGDRAIRASLTALEEARRANGPRDARPLIAHLELIDPADIPRFARIPVIPVFQPIWAYADSYITELTVPKLGPDRMRWVYPLGSIHQTGALMAMGSDWSVSSVNPLEGIEVAVTRQDPEGPRASDRPFYPEERLDLQTALAAYTIGSAFASFREKETGSIEAGKSADLIVLSRNLFEISPAEISEVKVLCTLFEGKSVYEVPEWAGPTAK